MPLCECGCGCGNPTSGPTKRFVTGHNGRGRRKTPASYKCKHCGVVTECMPSLATRTFCSNKCRDDFRRENIGEAHPSYKRVTLDCGICGKTFAVIQSRLAKNQVYCSMECGREGRRRKISGMRRIRPNPTGKNAAKRRDGFQCLICGFNHVVAAHHIIPTSAGGPNTIDNIITLCPNHHYMAHAGMLSDDELRALVASKTTDMNLLTPVVSRKAKNTVSFRQNDKK